jgi:SAM-dependent methyltransferase
MRDDEQNLELRVEDIGGLDAVNKRFYNRFPFPPPPIQIHFLDDPGFGLRMLNQNLGDWSHTALPPKPRVLVPGCGTFQAVALALQLPTADILGVDLAEESLATCRKAAAEIGLGNLTVREENILELSFQDELDYIDCDGVLHHLADPAAGFKALARALKPEGILRVMVYNRYHRIATSAFQKAVKTLLVDASLCDLDSGLQVARKLLEECPAGGRLREYSDRIASDSQLADTFLQPVEHSYTVESLQALVESCGLELLHPQVTLWDQTWNTYLWNMTFEEPELRERYEALGDVERWKITNWLRQESSPMLSFYLQRKDSGRPRKTEREICDAFLATVFERNQTTRRCYQKGPDDVYALAPNSSSHPPELNDSRKARILSAIDGRTPMGEILSRLGISSGFETVNRLRIELTTSAFPYLVAVSSRASEDWKGEAVGRLKARISAARKPIDLAKE